MHCLVYSDFQTQDEPVNWGESDITDVSLPPERAGDVNPSGMLNDRMVKLPLTARKASNDGKNGRPMVPARKLLIFDGYSQTQRDKRKETTSKQNKKRK